MRVRILSRVFDIYSVMQCDTLWCDAVCCSVLQCVAECGRVWQCAAARRHTRNGTFAWNFPSRVSLCIQYLAMCCNLLQCVAVCSSALQCVAARRHTRWEICVEISKLIIVMHLHIHYAHRYIVHMYQEHATYYTLLQHTTHLLGAIFQSAPPTYSLLLRWVPLIWGGLG